MKYDIIGDIHGCFDELIQLLNNLGYIKKGDLYIHPEGRRLAFVGDATDRGPKSIETLKFLFKMHEAGQLTYSPGNHCNKLYRFMKGSNVQQTHGLETTVAEFNALSKKEQNHIRRQYIRFYESWPIYSELDDRNLIVVHAGIRADMIGKPINKSTITFALYGDITGEKHPDGRPVRRDWAKKYNGAPFIVYGHTPVNEPRFIHNTVNIDTGCVFGNKLTALRYPEMETVSVPSSMPYLKEKFNHFDE